MRAIADSASPPNGPNQSVASKLLRAVIAKSFVEIVFVCAVATVAAFWNYSPLLRGAIDVADRGCIAGWVHDPLSPDEAIEVQLFIDGRFVATRRADERRDDLVEAGATANPNHGFTFRLESLNLPNGNHTARAYAVRDAAGSSKILLPITTAPYAFQISR